jgi:serine/threonine-protein kinase
MSVRERTNPFSGLGPSRRGLAQEIRGPQPPREPIGKSARAFTPGELVGGTLEVRGLLGRGGMGCVFEAFDRSLLRMVAIKVAGEHPDAPPVLEEGRALAAISSPSIVTVYGLGHHRGLDYLLMERIYGVSLDDRLEDQRARAQPLPLADALQLLTALAEGLAVTHQAGIVHWDLKPSNVMLTPSGRVVLLDFGIFVPAFAAAQAPMFRGTPAYSAPEAIRGRVEPTEAFLVDAYALGVLGFELFSGQLPFDAPTVEALWELHEKSPPPPLHALRPDAPDEVAVVIAELLAKEPADRPPSMQEVVRRLRQIRIGPSLVPEKRAPSVLIVEDDPDTLHLVETFVRRTAPAAEIRTAERADAALRLIRASAPDLLLLDLNLPDMGGLELCLHLRSAGLAERCRIVPVSGAPEDADRRLLLQLGLTQAVLKGPGALQEIDAVVKETFRLLGRSIT